MCCSHISISIPICLTKDLSYLNFMKYMAEYFEFDINAMAI